MGRMSLALPRPFASLFYMGPPHEPCKCNMKYFLRKPSFALFFCAGMHRRSIRGGRAGQLAYEGFKAGIGACDS